MDDLWGPSSLPVANHDIPAPTVAISPAATPSDLIAADVEHEGVIKSMIPEITKRMEWSDQLCQASWELSNYVPPGLDSNPERNRLWSNMLIPKMVQALVDDVKARNEIERSLSSVTTLATAINEGAALIKASRGSAKAIEVARSTIGSRLKGLTDSITNLQNLESAAIELFKNHASEILKIVGPSAANFAKQEAECQDVIDEQQRRARKLLNDRAEAASKVEKFNNLVHVQSTIVHGAEAAMEQTRARTQNLNSLINAGEHAINAIPDTIAQTTTETTHHRRGWWVWRRNWTTTSTVTRQVANSNKQAQVDYYNGIIQARNARVKDTMQLEGQQTDLLKMQQQELAAYQEELKKAQELLAGVNARITTELTEVDKAIAIQIRKINDIRQQADRTENEIGMKGSVLIDCLTAIRNFAKAEKDQTSLYGPLVSALEYVKSLTEQSVLMLDGDKADVYSAGVRLLKNVGFFIETSTTLRAVVSPSTERQELLQAAKQKAICA